MQQFNNEVLKESQMSLIGEMQLEKPQLDVQNVVENIIRICRENDAFFGDMEFPSENTSLFKNPDKLPDYHRDVPEIVWKRPQEIAPDYDPKMIKIKKTN